MATQMRRTQIYLPADLAEALDQLAHRRGTSRAEVIREAAERLIEEEVPRGEVSILGIVGMFNGGEPNDAALKHDRHLAKAELERWRGRSGPVATR